MWILIVRLPVKTLGICRAAYEQGAGVGSGQGDIPSQHWKGPNAKPSETSAAFAKSCSHFPFLPQPWLWMLSTPKEQAKL